MHLTTITKIFGAIFLLIGVLGFVPVLTPEGNLLSIFAVNTVHNIIHIATGAVALIAASGGWSKKFFQIFGIVYGLVAVLGAFGPSEPILSLVAHNHADLYLHILITLVALYLGFGYKE